MAIALAALDPIEGLDVRTAPVGGAVWDGAALHRLDAGVLAWSRPLDVAPRLGAAGRRLYVAFGDVLACLDLRTGADVWAVENPGVVTALAAHRDGVVVATERALQTYAPDGTVLAREPMAAEVEHLGVTPTARYAGGPGGVWRLDGSGRPTQLSTRPCLGLHARETGIQALVGSVEGTFLVEDDGLPLLWPFPDFDRHVWAPLGRGEWAVAPTAGRAGVWVVDRRVQARWSVPLPGRVRAIAAAGAAVAVLLEDGGTALALIHPDVSQPLLLSAEGADALHADGATFYLAAPGATRVYQLREA